MVRRAAVVIGAALAMAAPPAGRAQEGEAVPAAPKWMISCSNQADFDKVHCELSQSIVVSNQAGQSQRVAIASFLRPVGGTEMEARLALPYDVSLRDEVTVSVDANPLGTLAWQSCDGGGCYAGGAVPEAWMEAMRGGNQLVAVLKTRDGRDVSFTFTLEDFSRISALMP